LHTAPSVRIPVPRVAEAQASLECTLFSVQPLGANTLFIGEVVMFHIADQLMGPRLHINDFAPIGRLGSPSFYCRTTDRVELARISYAQWSSEQS
jgi:flavin reductase (DIM6/NTAB) family NADH-FMN oxidoreductase RutF